MPGQLSNAEKAAEQVSLLLSAGNRNTNTLNNTLEKQ